MKKKPLTIKILLYVLLLLVVWGFLQHDAFLYEKDICRITTADNRVLQEKTGSDGTHTYRETYYRQTLTGVLLNGAYRGKTVRFSNDFQSSHVYTVEYKPGDQVFLDSLKPASAGAPTALTAQAAGTKRDSFVLSVLVALFGLFLLVGGRRGALTILSLALNMAAFYVVLRLYLQGINLLAATIPMTVFFTAMLLFFMYGHSRRTWLSLAATLLTVLVTTGLAALVFATCGSIDYDFMEYLVHPYEPTDALMIFLSEILVGCLGAVMDVVVTIVMTCDQIAETSSDATYRDYIASLREVGDDLVGTMVNLMLFTNIAACLPAFLLYMRNGIALRTILHYNVFFELARFLTGSIGLVLAIPIAAALSIYWYDRHGRKEAIA